MNMSMSESNAPSTPEADSTRTVHKLLVLLVLVGGMTYSNSFLKPFHFDDIYWISNNSKIDDLGAYMAMMTSRRVVAITLHLNHRLHGLSVFGYHLVNLGIHIAAALALFGVVRRTLLLPRWKERFSQSAHWLAFAVALLWMVHPLQTQAVTYIIQRGESLMGMFFLLAFYCLIRGTQSSCGWCWNLASLSCFVLGANSKEVMVTFLPVMLCYDAIILASFRDMFRKRWWYYLAIVIYWAILLSGAFTALTADSADGSAGFGLRELKPQVYMMTQPGMLLHYIRLVFVPYPQAFSYRAWPWVTQVADVLPAGIAIGLLALVTAYLMLRQHWLGFLGAWFFGILSITSIVPLIDPGFEHRMYLPLAAFCVLVVMGTHCFLSMLLSHRMATRLALLLLVAASATLAALTMRRNEDYRSARSLWESVYAVFPNDVDAMNGVASALVTEGKYADAKQLYEKILSTSPNMYLAELGIGRALCRMNKPAEAIPHLRRSLKQLEGNEVRAMWAALANFELGKCYWLLEDRKSAEPFLREAIRLAPEKQDAHGALACILYEQNRVEEARIEYALAKQINPRFAQDIARNAEQIVHRQAESTEWSRKEALFLALQANQATDFKVATFNAVLADAYAANQMYTQAIQVVQNSLQRLDASADVEERSRLQRMLSQYQQQLKSSTDKKGKT